MQATDEQEPVDVDEEQRQLEDQILVHVLFQTKLVDKIIELLGSKSTTNFGRDRKTQTGYTVFLVELGDLLRSMKDKNEAVRECLEDNPDWQAFFDSALKGMIEQRKGALYDDPRFPKADTEEANFITRLIDNFKLPNAKRPRANPDDMESFEPKGSYEDDVAQTRQEDMDRLIQPYLSFEDEGEEVHEEFKVNEVEKKPDYDAFKYSSNSGRQKPRINYNEEEPEGDETSVMQ